MSKKEDACYQSGLISVDEAIDQLLNSVTALSKTETIKLDDALGRVLAEDIQSTIDVPGYDNSAMDGYAVQSIDCAESGAKLKVTQRIPAGQLGTQLESGCAARIFTGAPIPPGADAVVMQELCAAGENAVTINTTVDVACNIRRAGEDIKSGNVIVREGDRLRRQELGLIASIGIAEFEVFKKLRVAVFFTGDELVMPGEPLQDGQIYNSNRYTLNGLLTSLDCEIIDLGIVPDTMDATLAVLKKASEQADLILTSGGVSVGEEDYVKLALEKLGKLNMWRIAMKPGKPLAFGSVGNAVFMGLPGNPVSVFVTSQIFAKPVIHKMQGMRNAYTLYMYVKAAFDWKAGKRHEYLRARLNTTGDVEIYPKQGSGVLSSASWANGLVEVKPDKDIRKHDAIRFAPFIPF